MAASSSMAGMSSPWLPTWPIGNDPAGDIDNGDGKRDPPPAPPPPLTPCPERFPGSPSAPPADSVADDATGVHAACTLLPSLRPERARSSRGVSSSVPGGLWRADDTAGLGGCCSEREKDRSVRRANPRCLGSPVLALP
eukprot:354715-Chlamydomonas_euryale.AAC.1